MPSIVIAATHPQQPTGYARVGCALANELCALKWDVTYFGFQNLAPVSKRYVHPKIRVIDVAHQEHHPESFGEHVLNTVLKDLRPDVLLVYNDVIVVNAFLNAVSPETRPPKVVAYVDLVHDDEFFISSITEKVDLILVFSEHWLTQFPPGKATVLPHGVDDSFVPLDQTACRRALGLPEKGFLVLNTNRNSYRKALDVTIRVFLETYVAKKCPDDMYLFLNCNHTTESGYDIPHLIYTECRRLGLDAQDIASNKILGMPNAGFLTDIVLNQLYNASDVMMNTCVGEGFGLPHIEGARLGILQLVNATGGLKDIFPDTAIPPIEKLALCRGFVPHGGTMDIPDSKEFGARLGMAYDAWTSHGVVREFPLNADAYAWARIGHVLSDLLL